MKFELIYGNQLRVFTRLVFEKRCVSTSFSLLLDVVYQVEWEALVQHLLWTYCCIVVGRIALKIARPQYVLSQRRE